MGAGQEFDAERLFQNTLQFVVFHRHRHQRGRSCSRTTRLTRRDAPVFNARALFLLQFAFFVKIFLSIGWYDSVEGRYGFFTNASLDNL
jgi:hypothetical protein